MLQPPAAAATSSPSALKLEPQPQDATALGLLTVNPAPMRPSTKSTSAPLRYGQAEAIDDDLDAVLVGDLVAGLGLAVEAERVLEAGASATLHRDPQRERLGILAHEREHMLRGAFGEPDHVLMVPPGESPASPTL